MEKDNELAQLKFMTHCREDGYNPSLQKSCRDEQTPIGRIYSVVGFWVSLYSAASLYPTPTTV